jgi:hypothetical protein
MSDFIPDTVEYGNRILSILDTSRYFRLVNSLGSQLNDRKSRFDKSDIIEQSLDVYSNGILKWVDDIGFDLVDTEKNIKIEVKYEDKGLHTDTGNTKKIIKYKIKNTLKELTTSTLSDPADYYLFLDRKGMGLISYKDMEPHLHITKSGDGIECKIPIENVHVIVRDDTMKGGGSDSTVNYKQEKNNLQRKIINMIT